MTKLLALAGANAGNMKSIDAIRGYAVLLVIICHIPSHIAELVWPVKRLLLMGNYGVQLFFLASAVTLLMSWSKTKGNFYSKYKSFLIRRIFRIAPLYFSAIIFYWLVDGRTVAEFNLPTLLSTLLFYNAWSPYLMPATASWMPVPGGWSISVEFCFYLIFPILAGVAFSLKRSFLFFLISVLAMIFGFFIGAHLYPELDSYSQIKFLYFWPPNQLVIFSVGFVLYFSLQNTSWSLAIRESMKSPLIATIALVIAFVGFSYYPAEVTRTIPNALPPLHLIITVIMALWALIIINHPGPVIVNKWIVSLGEASFSVYILHFAVLASVSMAMERYWPFPKDGILSVAYAGSILVCSVFLSFLFAKFTYKHFELPFIRYAKRLTTENRASDAVIAPTLLRKDVNAASL